MPLGRVFLLLAIVGSRSKNSPVESGAFVWTVILRGKDWGVDSEDAKALRARLSPTIRLPDSCGKDAPFRALRNSMHPQNYDRCVIGLVPQRKFIHGSKDRLNQRVGALCVVFGNRS